jgi:isopenicillin-N N-acyltransferase-like protein
MSRAVDNTVVVYRRLLAERGGWTRAELRDHGRRVAGAMAAMELGDLVDEIEGIAAGARHDAEELVAINARTELLARSVPISECSLVGVVSNAGAPRCLLAQNWDWHPDLRESLVWWHVEGRGSRWFTTLTEAGMVAKLGMNSRGICVGLNFLSSSADEPLAKVPLHVLLRVLLDRTDTLSEALGLLLGADVAASACVTVGCADQEEAAAVSVELSPAGANVVWPDREGRLVHTNHFLAAPSPARDTGLAEGADSLVRWWSLSRRAPGFPGASPEGLLGVLGSHHGAPGSLCRHPRAGAAWLDRVETLLSVVFDPGALTMTVVPGAPCPSAGKGRMAFAGSRLSCD